MADWLPLIIAVLVPITLRIIDYLLPKGHHFRVVHKFAVRDEEDDDADGGVV